MSNFFPDPPLNKAVDKEQAIHQDQHDVQESSQKWSVGVLNTLNPLEVPGTVLLFTGNNLKLDKNENAPRQNPESLLSDKKKTSDGRIILEPQPDDSCNDPLNLPKWRKEVALISLGIYCMVGGGMTPILAAGFSNVASTFDVAISRVSLTTGLYMLGLGVGSVIASPTAILYGKRPVYLVSAIVFVASSSWCAASTSYNSLLLARIFQGISVSSVECLPSSTITEIFFLHERAFRIGLYSLLLLGGKNLVPLVSAVIIQSLDWRWVFWITVVVIFFCGIFLFLFLPETFWVRNNVGNHQNPSYSEKTSESSKAFGETGSKPAQNMPPEKIDYIEEDLNKSEVFGQNLPMQNDFSTPEETQASDITQIEKHTLDNTVSALRDPNLSSPENTNPLDEISEADPKNQQEKNTRSNFAENNESERSNHSAICDQIHKSNLSPALRYVAKRRDRPQISFFRQLKPYNGRISHNSWLRVAVRPLILFTYPAVLWSAAVYSCSIGWLIVISESVALLFRSSKTYNFSALSAGLIYISPFIGGILGTAIAGILSDSIVQSMSRRNRNIFEPEFRLVMAIPVAITTAVGLMGLGWSVQESDKWIVPTTFFGIISFGCSLGATTAITFCVDSYRIYAAEALVTLNFSKNVFHGFVFSLFVTRWVENDGPKTVFLYLGIIQLIFMGFTIPMYIFGKRARALTLRLNLMERF